MKHLMTKLTSGLLILTLVVGFLLNIMPAAMADDDAHTHGGQVFMPWKVKGKMYYSAWSNVESLKIGK